MGGSLPAQGREELGEGTSEHRTLVGIVDLRETEGGHRGVAEVAALHPEPRAVGPRTPRAVWTNSAVSGGYIAASPRSAMPARRSTKFLLATDGAGRRRVGHERISL